jgi:hypothetical protein
MEWLFFDDVTVASVPPIVRCARGNRGVRIRGLGPCKTVCLLAREKSRIWGTNQPTGGVQFRQFSELRVPGLLGKVGADA